MTKIRTIIIVLLLCVYPIGLRAQAEMSVTRISRDSVSFFKKAGVSLAEIAGVNLGVWAVDRYVLKSDFSFISKRTIDDNFKTGFVWDSDLMGTNFILHPYHGSLYFNAARSNGFNFYESIPFTMVGSMSWEYIFENEYPSINDLMATTGGGTMLGEVTYRLANRVLDNSATGINRVFREVFAGVISPINSLNRLISGEAWRRKVNYMGDKTPVNLDFSAGIHFLRPRMHSDYQSYAQLALNLEYNPNRIECEKPYDWFELGIRINMNSHSFYINKMHVSGLLWNKILHETETKTVDFGIYQHLDYLDSPSKIYQQTPYRVAQVLAVGPGIHYNAKVGSRVVLDSRGYFTGVGLGAVLSDYYWVVDRDYNFGSGFSANLGISVSINNRLRFKLTADSYHLFTWKGYDPNRNLYMEDLKMLDVQGDKGAAKFTYIEAEFGYQSKHGWNVYFSPSYISRSSHYKYRPSVSHSTCEFALRIGYAI